MSLNLDQIEARINSVEKQVKALESMDKRVRSLEKALTFYADKKHVKIPVEDGSVARKALYGNRKVSDRR